MDRARLAAQLEIDEKRCRHIYVDTVGKVTGGVGRNLTDRGFSDDEIDLMRDNDIAAVERELDRALPWWRQMNEARQNALANMAFNMGVPSLLGFRKMLALMAANRFDAAAAEAMESKWATQVGERAKRISDLIRKGEF